MADNTPPPTTAPPTTAPSTTAPSTTAPLTTTQPTTAPSATAPSTTAVPTTASPTTAVPTTIPPTTAPPTTAPSTTTPSTTASPTTAVPTTAPLITALPTTAPLTTAPPTSAPSTTTTKAPLATAPSTTAPSTTASSSTAPSSTVLPVTSQSVTPSSTAPATASPSEEVSSNTQEEETKRETDKREPKREETQRLQRSKKIVTGADRRGYHVETLPTAEVEHEATSSVPVTDKVSLEVTLRFHVKNFSKVNMLLSSAPCWLHGMPFMIKAGPVIQPSNEDGNKEEIYLSMALRCGGVWGAAFWACYGTMELCLLPASRNQAPHIVGTECLFEKNVPFVGVSRFMLWEDVLNPHHGYIANDAVTFQVRLRIAPPYVISWTSDRLVRVPVQTPAVLPPQVTSGRKGEDIHSDDHEDDSDDDSNGDDSDDGGITKDDGLYAQKNMHMYM